jgi:diacylglycerol kinase (ATP)
MKYNDDLCPIVMNVRAGALHGMPGAEQLKRMARDVGFEADILQTHSTDEMRQTIRRLVAGGVSKVGVAGGDGTVETAVQDLARTETALGILPQGTFNNFATALRLPHNLPAALRILHRGRRYPVDLGFVKGRYFTESAGVGLFADGLALYGQGTNKNLLRGLSTALRLALSLRPQEMQITVDGVVRQERLTMCEVTNTYRIAQAVPIAPEADVDDGQLDIILLGPLKRRELLPYFNAMRAQMHLDLPKVTALRTRREVTIESHRRRNVHADDTIIGTTPVTITVEPHALTVLMDEDR